MGVRQWLEERSVRLNISLTADRSVCIIVGTSSLGVHSLSGPEFHAEWLRDEPADATATGSGSYIPNVWCQLSPGNREHGIRQARCICFPIASFPFPGKRGHLLLWPLFPARPQLFANKEARPNAPIRSLALSQGRLLGSRGAPRSFGGQKASASG